MNLTNQLPAPTTGRGLPVPILIFEFTDTEIPVRLASNFAAQDLLRDDQDLVEDSRRTQRPARWSPLNDF